MNYAPLKDDEAPTDKMKRYWAFGGADFYPEGGLCDFIGSFDTQQEAVDEIVSSAFDWYQLLDSQSGIIVDFQKGCYSGDLSEEFLTPTLVVKDYDEA